MFLKCLNLEERKIMSTPRYMYLTVSGRRVGCLAVNMDRARGVVSYRTSVLHKNDVFSKEKARVIASGRLAVAPVEVSVPYTASSHEISTAVMLHLSRCESTPSSARKAAVEWLRARAPEVHHPTI